MKWQNISKFLQVFALVGPLVVFLATGGFNFGSQLTQLRADVQLLRHEVVAQNTLQNYRLDKLEVRLEQMAKRPSDAIAPSQAKLQGN